MITENLSTLKIHKLTQAQYERERDAGRLDENIIYLTPDEGPLDFTETDPTVPAWAKEATKPSYTAAEVGADASGTASSAVLAHNASTSAHADIRNEISQLTEEKEALENRVSELEKYHSKGINLIPSSINADGTPYNGGIGYKEGYRLSSTGVEKVADTAIVSGFIPYNGEDIKVCIPNAFAAADGNYLQLYGANFELWNMAADGTLIEGSNRQFYTWEGIYGATRVIDTATNTQTLTVPKELIHADTRYVRVSAYVHTTVTKDTFSLILVDNANTEEDEPSENTSNLPEYWMSHLNEKVDEIQQTMEQAGRNKSAFLWYTDAHWPSNSKVSPKLLKYLVNHTSMNKVNFGGDIVGDPNPHNHENTKYVYEWREAITGLPNHHSVYGNHDVNHRSTDVSAMAYAQLIAPEESADMVVGGDSCYYIDNPAEKTRYLYLSYLTSNHTQMMAQGEFIVSALMSVAAGWHIVAIAHRWWQYNSSANPTVGAVPTYEKEILSIFDAYNARETRGGSNYFYTQDFTEAKGKVEFCIGGHIHVDYDFKSDGGIPVIVTTADANQNRVPDTEVDSGTTGTTTESAVFGVVADYNETEYAKITIIGIGRGTSRVVSSEIIYVPVNEVWTSITDVGGDIFNKDDTPGYQLGKRLNSSCQLRDASGCVASGYVLYTGGDIEVILPTVQTNNANTYIHLCLTYNGAYAALLRMPDGTAIDGSKRQAMAWVDTYGATRTIANGVQKIVIPKSLIPEDTEAIRISSVVDSGLEINDNTFSIKNLTVSNSDNLFDKNDSNVVLNARFNSSKVPVAYAEGQLITGYFEGKIGDTFTIKSDKAQNTNGYTGTMMLYDANKTAITSMVYSADETGGWTWSADSLSGSITITSDYYGDSHEGTAFVRFCIAYTDVNSIVITKTEG